MMGEGWIVTSIALLKHWSRNIVCMIFVLERHFASAKFFFAEPLLELKNHNVHLILKGSVDSTWSLENTEC